MSAIAASVSYAPGADPQSCGVTRFAYVFDAGAAQCKMASEG
jgi:hypothetical protein